MKIKTRKILFNDYQSFLLTIVTLVTAMPPAILAWIVLMPLLIRRVRFIKRTIQNGDITPGKITQCWLERSSRWIIRYTYSVGGTTYVTRNVIVAGWSRSTAVELNQSVQVHYNPKNPKEALVPDFYLTKEQKGVKP